MMIHACNAETFASVQMVNPDSERSTLVKAAEGEPEQKLWNTFSSYMSVALNERFATPEELEEKKF